jgi:GntR family transcriptional regulator, N-acetylglucosamine utilization regulator
LSIQLERYEIFFEVHTLNLAPLDRQSVVPLYYQIQRRLLEQIRLGAFQAGQSLPSEQEISEQLGVSRMTGRQALKSLRDLGVTYSIQGKGTFVSGIKLEKDFRQVASFTEEMQARGLRPKSKVLSFEVIPSDDESANALQLMPGDRVISLRRIRFADSSPVGIEWSRIPLRRCPDLIDVFDARASLYETLAQHYGIRMALANEVVEAGLATIQDSKLLEVSKKSAVFLFTRISYLQNGEPTEFVKSVYRGDRYKIVNRLTRVNRELLSPAK